MWFEQMHADWQRALTNFKPWLEEQEAALAGAEIAPPRELVMAAFADSPADVRVVWAGQDPYPTPEVAVGRSFAVSEGATLPGSLRNIFKELASDLHIDTVPNRTLSGWQQQGVMLLNRHLTTLVGASAAHQGVGWNQFTDAAMRHLIGREKPLVLVLLGTQAQAALKDLGTDLAGTSTVRVVTAVHPSPLSAHRGFFGSMIFSRINQALIELGQAPIDWSR